MVNAKSNKAPDITTMGGRLKYIRIGIGMTREDFAELIQIKPRRLVMIELNERRIGEDDIENICRALLWSVHWLTYGGKMEDHPMFIKAKITDLFPKMD